MQKEDGLKQKIPVHRLLLEALLALAVRDHLAARDYLEVPDNLERPDNLVHLDNLLDHRHLDNLEHLRNQPYYLLGLLRRLNQ